MNDLIDRQAAMDAPVKMVSEGLDWIPVYHIKGLPSAQPDNRLSKIADLVEGTIDHFDLDDAMDLLYQIKDVLDGSDELPSAQPERKNGEWTKDCACGICGFKPWYERDIHTLSFCPNCGADMRGEQNED